MANTTTTSQDPPYGLTCCCCGSETIGRQWWNRDTGYGLCASCADHIEPRIGPENFHSYYGIRGVHFDVRGEDETT